MLIVLFFIVFPNIYTASMLSSVSMFKMFDHLTQCTTVFSFAQLQNTSIFEILLSEFGGIDIANSMVHEMLPSVSNDIHNLNRILSSKDQLLDAGGWLRDFELESQITDTMSDCDFPILHWQNAVDAQTAFQLAQNGSSPFILRGWIDGLEKDHAKPANLSADVSSNKLNASGKWTASRLWTRESLIRLYGNRIIKMGSQSAIIWNAGVAPNEIALQDYLDGMRTTFLEKHIERKPSVVSGTCKSMHDSNQNGGSDRSESGNLQMDSDSFSFDNHILKAIPELNQQFSSPPFLSEDTNQRSNTQPSNGRQKHNRQQMSVILSLGQSRTGLPFHTHGDTWLGLVYGKKMWFIYPPWAQPPKHVMESTNPMSPVYHWYTHILPMMKDTYDLPAHPLPFWTSDCGDGARFASRKTHTQINPGFKPFQCIQQAGDVVFLPALWSHQTMNIGETIGIGGQQAINPFRRLELSQRFLKQDPQNVEMLKNQGIALAGTHDISVLS
jgi:hypothetical protein